MHFNNVRNITLYIEDNYGDDVSRLWYLGFKGEWTELKDTPVVAVYEVYTTGLSPIFFFCHRLSDVGAGKSGGSSKGS